MSKVLESADVVSLQAYVSGLEKENKLLGEDVVKQEKRLKSLKWAMNHILALNDITAIHETVIQALKNEYL